MKKIVLGLAAIASVSTFAQDNLTVGKVSFGTFLKNEKFVTKTVVTTKSGKILSSEQSNSRDFSWNSCLIGETAEYSDLPYNIKVKDQIKSEVCSKARNLQLSYRCNLDSSYLATTAGGDFVRIKAVPEMISITLSNNEEVSVDCDN